ncbi:hypothetical protein A9Q81_22460 [Gammaproteobacteria bacterium 42_54_T18]|nr:hypothetical protein A9Q81_22460 [Gammaproteobacteria bacterium 42_54_T18]
MHQFDNMALFAEVALTGSFTKAADKTGVPLSTISRRISELEEDIGIQLLRRTTRRLDVTDAGKVFLKHCQEVIQQGYQARQAIESLKEEPKGHIRMAAPFPPDDSWTARVISEFLKLYPQITLEHIRSNSAEDMDRLELDVMLVSGKRPETNHSLHDIGSIGMMLVGSPNYFVEHGIPKIPEDLSQHHLLNSPNYHGTTMPLRHLIKLILKADLQQTMVKLPVNLLLAELGLHSFPSPL